MPAIATEPTSETSVPLPESDQAFRVEQHGINFIPLSERWAKPRDIGSMWAGASIQVEYLVYGAILMTFGFTFAQALSLVLIGNVSYFLLGLCSLQGPQAGTTVFGVNRAPYGSNGSRTIAFFNWITQLGFEVEGLILIVGAALALDIKAGFNPGSATKAIFVVLAILVQGVLPFLGHATIVKTLRALAIPFLVIFAVMVGFAIPHATTHGVAHGADWQTYLEGLAFTITLSGLGWTENGNDYTRYCRPDTSRRGIVLWVFLGTAVPQILIMLVGVTVGTFLSSVGKASNAFLPLVHQSTFPAWFVVLFLVFSMLQLFAINSLDLYSSGVTLLAIGAKVKRYQAVMIDCVIAFAVTMYAVFNTSFSGYMKDFVDVVIVWIAPWTAIYLVDWVLRRLRYVPAELQRTARGSLYYRKSGVFWPAIVAQVVGMYAALTALSTSFHIPRWLNPLTTATRDASGYGADFSIFMGMGVAALVYVALGLRGVRAQAAVQDEMLAGEPDRIVAP